MGPVIRQLAACLLLATSGLAAAQGTVHVVSNTPCVGGFTDTQSAVDAAADGDTVLVQLSGFNFHEGFTIDGKSLTVIMQGGHLWQFGEFVRVVDLPADGRVVLRGMQTEAGLQLQDCAGEVWVEDCLFAYDWYDTPGIEVVDCDAVVLQRSEFRGSGATFELPPPPGMRVVNSNVVAHGCRFVGADARLVLGSGIELFDAAPGARVEGDSFVHLDRCELVGGEGGEQSPCPGGPGSDGGDGLQLLGTQLTAWTNACSFLPGPGGSCPVGEVGVPVSGSGASLLLDLGGGARDMQLDAFGFGGGTVDLQLEPLPGDEAFLLVALEPSLLPAAQLNGALLGAPVIQVAPLGRLLGPLDLEILMPPPALPTLGAMPLIVQAAFVDGDGTWLGPASALTWAEASVETSPICVPLLWVDDDAPGDPGPGDPAVSDPLADGSLEHPFDSIQDAIAAGSFGTEIRVRPGGYGIRDLDFADTDMVLRSTGGRDVTFLLNPSSGSFDPLFAFRHESELSVVEGFTLLNAPGHAVLCSGASAPRFVDCRFKGSSSAALLVEDDARPTLVGCEIVDGDREGVKTTNGCTPVLSGCSIRDNAQEGVLAQSASTVTLIDCELSGNGQGGLQLDHGASAFVDRCRVLHNAQGGSPGAGIVVEANTSLTLRSSLVARNGPAVSAGVLVRGHLDARGSTLTHNHPGTGSALSVQGGEARLDHCIVWGDAQPAWLASGSLELLRCDVENGLAGVFHGTGTLVYDPANLAVDPLFVDAANDDYHLQPHSPLRDAGDPAFVPEPGETDIDGEDRVMGPAVDIGADEL